MKYYNAETNEILTPGDQRVRFGTILSQAKLKTMGFLKIVDSVSDHRKNIGAAHKNGITFNELMEHGPLVRAGDTFRQTYYPTMAFVNGFAALLARRESGLSLTSPDGTIFALLVDNSGTLSTQDTTPS